MREDTKKAIFIAKKLFAELVYDVTSLEGMPYTFPEVQTQLQGITVGGHKISDQKKLEQQALAWKRLIEMVEKQEFSLSKEIACQLQSIVAKDEAAEIGTFRSGGVVITGTTYIPPRAEALDNNFREMLRRVSSLDVQDKGIVVSLDFARNQFFFDGNKRTGILMMNGIFLSNGMLPLSISAKRLLEYNETMIGFYESGRYEAMTAFLKSCHAQLYVRAGQQ